MQRERCLIIEVVNHELANIMEGIDKEKATRWVLGDENLVAQKLIKLKQQIAKEIEVENLALEEISRLRKGDEKSLEDIKTQMEGAAQVFIDRKLINLEKKLKVSKKQTSVCILLGALAFTTRIFQHKIMCMSYKRHMLNESLCVENSGKIIY